MTATTTPLPRSLSRRNVLAALVAAPSLAAVLAACGSESVQSAATTGDTTGATTGDTTGGTSGGGAGIDHPTGADDVVLRLAYVGGFVPVGYAFTSAPTLLITGDGRAITAGVVPAIYPGPLLPALMERSISEAGIQQVLELAETAELLQAPPSYEAELNVADAPDTLVVLHAKGETFTHQAPALGFETPEKTAARTALATFVERVADLEKVAGSENLGPDAPLVATSYRMQARPVTAQDLTGYDIEPTIVPWPTTAGVALADAAECAVVDAGAVGTLFSDANQLTFFSDAEITYQVAVIAVLPGDTC